MSEFKFQAVTEEDVEKALDSIAAMDNAPEVLEEMATIRDMLKSAFENRIPLITAVATYVDAYDKRGIDVDYKFIGRFAVGYMLNFYVERPEYDNKSWAEMYEEEGGKGGL